MRYGSVNLKAYRNVDELDEVETVEESNGNVL